MINKNKKLIIALALIVLIGWWIVAKSNQKQPKEEIREITPTIGTIETFISTTGIIQPQNRLEIKPPINGRIEKILVKEGEHVKAGQIVAWMSSTERAALLDAARAQDEKTIEYWQDVYKPTPLIAPIDGEVIVSTNQPGQTVLSSDVVLVLSDHLIVQAQVDETDIGKVQLGQTAEINLDAYPDKKLVGKVDHIYYESKIVNNVTIYQVDIILESVPEIFRSGMSTNVNIVAQHKDNVLLIPAEALKQNSEGNYVLVKLSSGKKQEKQKVEVGVSDDRNVEIISGITTSDKVLIVRKKFNSQNSKAGSNPFMPARRSQGQGR